MSGHMEISRKSIERYLNERFEGAKLRCFERLGKGVHGTAYSVRFERDGKESHHILKTLFPRNFGHDHFSDRAQVLILANEAYNLLPRHVKALDVIGISEDRVVSIGDCKEFFILMEEAKGENYFREMDIIRERGSLTERDRKRARVLAEYLADIHSQKKDDPVLYKRRIRDTVGHGECLMGVFDTYPEVKFIDNEEIVEIVSKAVRWWGRIKDKGYRLSTVHGDFHPGNIWWSNDDFILLDRSRGIYGEPGDDVSCLSINYIFYSLWENRGFKGSFKELFGLFLKTYLQKTDDYEMLKVLAPFFAFRVAVIANPIFYPDVDDYVRRKLLNFAQNVLDEDEFNPEDVEMYLL